MNHLKNEKSPYLLQHKDNPVDWYPWCEEAFRKAEQEDKMIFLSIGYSTCHWCHVMAHESFEDEEVAKLLNQNFVSVKVDREERQDIDAVYMDACMAVNGSGGWPLTCILTPDQKPFFAGTYYPKQRKYGQAGLLEILQQTVSLWKNKRDTIFRTGNQITEWIRKEEIEKTGIPDKKLLEKAADIFKHHYDSRWGGFGKAPKFPMAHNLLFLMKYARLEKRQDLMEMAEHTLDGMARGGIFDHIGGGFSRYSTDEKWLIPHFEKMLYDNVLLSLAYLEAYELTGKEEYAVILNKTLHYVLRELTGENGEFFCGQDADSDGIEGKYYLFTREEVVQVLGEKDGEKFCQSYDIRRNGNFEGKSIPNRIFAGKEDKEWEAEDPRWEKLLQYRMEREYLHKDDKALLSWNSWMIIALAKAGKKFQNGLYQSGAVQAEQFIQNNMIKENGQLLHRWREGEGAFDGQLDDYAVYGLALLALYEAVSRDIYLERAIQIAEEMITLFEDKEKGGYFLTASNGEKLITRPKEIYDGAIPSGNSAAALFLVRLNKMTGDNKWQKAEERQIQFLTGHIKEQPYGHSFGLLALLEVLYPYGEELPERCRDGVCRL